MSVQFQNNQQQEVHLQEDVEANGHAQREFNRMTSTEERAERTRVRRIFESFDRNRDGRLSVSEMKSMIRQHQCENMPAGLSKRILQMADADGDGYLDFDEFYNLSQEHHWLFKNIAVKYCRYIVPRRDGGHITDEPVPCNIAGNDMMAARARLQSASTYDSVDGAYENSMTFWPPPLTMIIFSILEVIAFVVDIVALRDYDNSIETIGTNTSGPAATLFIYNPRKREQAWRFVTYMFVHVGVMHIMMNLVVQLFLGVALELVHHWWRVALVYLAGVLAGSMGTSIASPHIYLAGASGGVYALITAHIATIIMNWREMEFAVVQLFVFLVFCGTDIGMSVYRHVSDPYDRVGYMAHLCGAIAGLLVGIGVLRNLNIRPWEKKLWWVAVTLYVGLMVTGICFHIFYPDYFYLPPAPTSLYSNGIK